MTAVGRLLVVDDDLAIRGLIVNLLGRIGHEVRCASDGCEALYLLPRFLPHAVVLDMRLPKVSGDAVLAYIAARQPLLPVVCISGYATIPDAVSAIRTGAVNYLSKPFHPSVFLDVVGRALEESLGRPEGTDRRSSHIHGDWSDWQKALPTSLPSQGLWCELADLIRAGLELDKSSEHVLYLRERALRLCIRALIGSEPADLQGWFAWVRVYRTLVRSGQESAASIVAILSDYIDMNGSGVVANCNGTEIVKKLAGVLAVYPRATAAKCAREFGLSGTSLSKKLLTGPRLTFRQVRWSIVVRPVVRLIATTNEHIGQLAYRAGYEHHNQFDRDFKRMLGSTPKEFRRQAREEGPHSAEHAI